MAEAGGAPAILRLCLDLNVRIGDFLGHRRGLQEVRLPASRRLVQAAIDGRYEAIPVQIIVSWGMLDRLRMVLAMLASDDTIAEGLINDIAQWAQLGPEHSAPHLLLGGTGVIGMRDEEDRHVLETARAARVRLVATANFRDFLMRDSEIFVGGQSLYRSLPELGNCHSRAAGSRRLAPAEDLSGRHHDPPCPSQSARGQTAIAPGYATGCISKPAGRPARRAAAAGGNETSHRLASKRQPLTLSASRETT